jgi:hypothetical protein
VAARPDGVVGVPLHPEPPARRGGCAAFLALARSARSDGGRGAVAGWIHRVAVNATLKLKARRRPTAELPDVPARAGDDAAGREFQETGVGKKKKKNARIGPLPW